MGRHPTGRPPGRPPGTQGPLHTVSVQVLLTEDEAALLDQYAQARGLRAGPAFRDMLAHVPTERLVECLRAMQAEGERMAVEVAADPDCYAGQGDVLTTWAARAMRAAGL